AEPQVRTTVASATVRPSARQRAACSSTSSVSAIIGCLPDRARMLVASAQGSDASMMKRRRPDNRPQAKVMTMPVPSTLPVDVTRVRTEFPALAQRVNGRPLVYLDSAATAQKPRAVLDAVLSIDARDTGNVHSAVHALGVAATERFEGARAIVRRFLGAADTAEIV